MDTKEFSSTRQELEKTQNALAQLLGISIRAVQAFEQGWRRVPVHIERQMFFLLAMKKQAGGKLRPCWKILECSRQKRQACPAWEFRVGHLCWFINGTICQGRKQESWGQKMKVCRKCSVFKININL
jgi:hypothetical protein